MKQTINKICLFTLGLFMLNSCIDNEPEALFNDTTFNRIDQQIKDVEELLLSSEEGWKVTYFTDDSQLGGFTYLMDFAADKTVEMDSDFGSSKGVRTKSEWEVILGSTVKLSFSTKNKIHELSDSDDSPDVDLLGQGYLGSFEFLYYGKEGEDLIFRANRGFNEVRFKKATITDWDDLSKNDAITGFFDAQISYEVGGVVNFLTYNSARRFASNINSQINDTDFGIGFTPTGVVISPAITANNGISYTDFILNETKDKLVSEDGAFFIKLKNPPFNIYQFWVIIIDEPGEVSTTFLNTFNAINAANTLVYNDQVLAPFVVLGSTFRDTPYGVLLRSVTDIVTGDGFSTEYNLNFEHVVGSATQINITKLASGFNWDAYRHLDPLVDLIIDNSPFETELNQAINPSIVRLTSVSNPDVWFTIRR